MNTAIQAVNILQRMGSGVSLDPDITDYGLRVTAAGGTLPVNYIDHLYTFVDDIGTDRWGKIKDMWKPAGNFSSAPVKIKYADAAFKNTLLTGYVSGDFNTTTMALTNNGGTKTINSQIIPDNYGLNRTNFSLGVMLRDQVSTGTIFGGSQPASGGLPFYLGKTYIGLKGGTLQPLTPDLGTGQDTFTCMSLTTDRVVFKKDFYDLLPPPPNASLSPASNPFPDAMTLSRMTNFGSGVNGTGQYLCYIMGEYLTSEDWRIILIALRKLLVNTGSITEVPHNLFIGDSIVFGFGVTAAQRYTALLSASEGRAEKNMGISGCLYRASAASLYGVFDRRAQMLDYNIYGTTKVRIGGATNDCRADTGTGTPATIADYKSKLKQHVNEMLAAGVPAANIQLLSITYMNEASTNQTRIQNWNTAIQEAAAETTTPVTYIDLYTPMVPGGDANLQADKLHISVAGNILIRDTILAA